MDKIQTRARFIIPSVSFVAIASQVPSAMGAVANLAGSHFSIHCDSNGTTITTFTQQPSHDQHVVVTGRLDPASNKMLDSVCLTTITADRRWTREDFIAQGIPEVFEILEDEPAPTTH